MSVWALLQSALDDTRPRPADSVTPTEYAERAGVSHSRAAFVLRHDARLRAVHYRTNGRRGVCYVVAS